VHKPFLKRDWAYWIVALELKSSGLLAPSCAGRLLKTIFFTCAPCDCAHQGGIAEHKAKINLQSNPLISRHADLLIISRGSVDVQIILRSIVKPRL
jgi:hypothetical protein